MGVWLWIYDTTYMRTWGYRGFPLRYEQLIDSLCIAPQLSPSLTAHSWFIILESHIRSHGRV